jgi:phosphoribosylformimino-5-aminoimidazole carboxamide ribonucleotide (ProFAR) isomerase
MDLPNIISKLVAAQNNHNSTAFVKCFAESAIVFDEYEIHTGKKAIKEWIERANYKFKNILKPIAYTKMGASIILDVEVSGTFDQGPLMLGYHFKLAGGRIHSLLITNIN